MHISGLFYSLTLGKREIYFHGNRNQRKIALTFDDGPSQETEDVLRILKRYNARATFFVLGKKVKNNTEILRKIIQQGSEVGNHSYHHPSLIGKSKEFSKQQIEKTDSELSSLKIKTRLFRPPYGKLNYYSLLIAKKLNKKIILWDVDPKDWRRRGIKTTSGLILKKIKNGSIVDLHDFIEGFGENTDLPKILNLIIPLLQKRGYKLVTVSELLNLE